MAAREIEALSQRLDQLDKELQAARAQLQRLGLEQSTGQVQSRPASGVSNTTIGSGVQVQTGAPSTKPPGSLKKMDYAGWESFLGGNLLGKLGFLALVLTAGWFIKLAIDNHWVNESGRIITGLVVGFGMLGFSILLARKKYRLLWPLAAGSGYAIIFISIYAAYYFYDLLFFSESFGTLVLLSVAVSLLALGARSQTLYIFALLGALLIPILHSQGENSYRFLFSYLLVLQLVYMVLGFKVRWIISAYILYGLSTFIVGIWMSDKIMISNPYIFFAYLLISLLLLLIRLLVIQPERTGAYKLDAIPAFIIVLIYLTLAFITAHLHFYENRALVLLAFVLLGGAGMLRMQKGIWQKVDLQPTGNLWQIFWLILVFVVGATGVSQVSHGVWWVMLLVALAGILFFVGARLRSIPLILLSSPIYFALLFVLYFGLWHLSDLMPVLNQRFLLYLLTVAGLVLGTYAWSKRPLPAPLRIFAFASLFFLLMGSMVEVADLFRSGSERSLMYSMVLIFYSLIFFGVGFARKSFMLRWSGIGMVSLLVLKFYTYDIFFLGTGWRVVSGLCLGITLVLASYLYQKFKDRLDAIL